MDPFEKRELKRKARMRLAAQQRRAGLLRGRVVALSLICFVVLWGVVFAQMATGNDPVLGSKEKPVAISGPKKPSAKKVNAAHRRALELEAERKADSAKREAEAEAEAAEAEGGLEESEGTEVAEIEAAERAEAEAAESAAIEAAEIEAAEIAEIEAAEIAEAEAEPLVTSQS